jgi:hypothetical protein
MRLKPPPTAVTFALLRLEGFREKGKRAKVVGPPLPDGSVPDRWNVSEFSPANILAAFGPDLYRVDWYDAAGKRISGHRFRVAEPAETSPAKIEKPRRGRTRSRDEDDDEPRERDRGGSDSISFRELLAMQAEDRREADRREERADQRRREEAAAAQQRDREFMATMVGALVQTRTQPAAEGDLLRRELQLEIRRGIQELREEIDSGEDPDPDDTRDPPADVEEGLARVGSAILGELEERAPHLVNELIPQVGEWLKSKGFAPSQELADQIARRTANGRGHAGQS